MVAETGKKIIFPLIIVVSAIAMFMASLDGTIVNIALPTIADSFHLSSTDASWVSTIYMLVTAGSMLIVGKLADTLGYKKMFIFGFVVFTIGSFACGLLPGMLDNYSVLLVFRVIQAIGGVCMIVVSPAFVIRYMPVEKQGKGMGIIMLFASLGIALGPTLGGLITECLSWTWVFYINIPIGVIAIILGLIFLPKDTKSVQTMKGFDGIGACLIFLGLAALLFFISEGSVMGWASLPIILSLVIAVVSIVWFGIHERKAKSPILDFTLFKNRSFLLMNIIYAVVFFIFSGANYLLPFYLEKIAGLAVANAGFVMSSLSFGMMIAGLIAGFIYDKIGGKRKYMLTVATVLITAGFFLLTRLSPVSGMGIVITALALIGFGLGLISTGLSTMILGSASKKNQGMVSSLVGLERSAPMTVGIAVFNLLLICGIKYVARHTDFASQPIMNVVPTVLTSGFDIAFLVGMIISIIVFILTFFVREKRA